ncbi:hypothetical protein W02_24250 [Nitrospira sp. KM1]|nr:hypothetical protein W02_24250 [Nitrospira sp. KM1]
MERPKIPTDLEILREIYDRHYQTYVSFSKESPSRSAKIMVPIDIVEIAKHFKVDVDIIFGRLYYHLEEKFGFTRSDGSKVHFFALKAGSDIECVNFPLMASVLAGLHEERKKHLWAILIAVGSLIIAIVSLIVSALSK